jgi:hypothetical protein
MASIDELAAAIGAAKERIDQVGAGFVKALSHANELREEFASLGATDKTAAIEAARRDLESGHRIAVFLSDRAEGLRHSASVLGENIGASTSAGPAPAAPGGTTEADPKAGSRRPRGVPATWTDAPAANGKGRVWRRPGSKGNADTLRLMEPNERYPYGYVRFYNQYSQPIGLDGKPGGRDITHIPVKPDGTYDIPQGWHTDDAD